MRITWLLCFLILTVACHKTKVEPMNGDLLYTQYGDTLASPYTRFQIINDSTVNLIKPDLTIKTVQFHDEGITELHLEGACIITCSERLFKILRL